jgi:gliding motility-associated-like protein
MYLKGAFYSLITAFAVVLFSFDLHAQCWPRSEKMLPEKAPNNAEGFGRAMDFQGTLAVVGAPQSDTARTSSGVVYLFEYDGSRWKKVASLSPSVHKLYHNFGSTVKIAGDYILVGDPTHEVSGKRVGGIYVFQKPAGGWHDMVETSIVTSSDSRCLNLGTSLDVYEQKILAGAPYSLDHAGKNTGAAYVFEIQGTNFIEIARLSTSHLLNSTFGSKVALKKDIAVVVASEETEPTSTVPGSAYVFEKSTLSSWTDALPTARLKTDAPLGTTWPLGSALAIDETRSTVFVTDYFYGGQTDIHAEIRMYKKPVSGWQDKVQDLVHQYTGPYYQTMSFDEPFLYFTTGSSVDIAAPGPSGEWESLTPVAQLRSSDFHSQLNFGSALVAKDGRVMVAAPGGVTLDRERPIIPVLPAVYEFEVPPAGWASGIYPEVRKFKYMPRTATDFAFGHEIDIEGEFAVVAAPNDNYKGKGAGVVYVYQLVNLHWNRIAVLSPSDGEPNDYFGGSVAISKNFIAVGAVNKHFRDQSGKIVDHNLGAVYIFERPASGWADMEETYKLVKSDNHLDYTNDDRLDDNFGVSLDLDFPTLVVGKYERGSRPNLGSVFVYNLGSGTPVLEATLDPSTRSAVNDFGHAVRIENNTIAISGGPLRFWFIEANVVFIYVKKGETWTSGTESAMLRPSDISYGAAFGYSIDMTEDASKIIVGAPGWFKEGGMAYTGNYFKGAAYIYEKPATGWQGSIEEKVRLTVDGQQSFACMGLSVYIEDRYAAVGSPQNYITTSGSQNAGSGRVYFYQIPDNGWVDKQPDKVIEGDEAGNPISDYFGSKVKGVYGYLLIGAIADDNQNSVDAGSVYVYTEYPFIFPGQSPICENNPPVQLTAFPTGGEWSGGGFQNPSSGIFDAGYAGAGIHRIKYKVDDCDASNVLHIDVRNALEAFSLSTTDSVFFCGTREKKLNAPSGNQLDYSWAYSPDGNNFTEMPRATAGELTVATEGFYMSSISNDCSTARDTVWVGNLYPQAGDDFEVCASNDLQVLTGNYLHGTWTGKGVTNQEQFSSQLAGRGQHELIYSISPASGCIYRDTLLARVKGIPALDITALDATSFCYTGSTTLQATPMADVTYQWFFTRSGVDFIEMTPVTHVLNATELGTYKVFAFDGLCGREETYRLAPSDFVVDILPNFDSLAFCHNSPVDIRAQSIPDASYRWISLKSDDGAEVLSTSFDDFSTQISETGKFRLEVDNHGCSFVSHVMSTSRILGDSIFIPNVITPNGDGFNDRFDVYTEGIDHYSLRIFDRYGSEAFRSDGKTPDWQGDGTSGVYFWFLSYHAQCKNRQLEFRGTLHVLR